MSVVANIQTYEISAVISGDVIQAHIDETPLNVTIANSVTFTGGGGDASFIHTQAVPSATWTVNHGLNKYPSIRVLFSGEVVEANVVHNSMTQATITLNAPATGLASCN